jgi:hypothetical protein
VLFCDLQKSKFQSTDFHGNLEEEELSGGGRRAGVVRLVEQVSGEGRKVGVVHQVHLTRCCMLFFPYV